MPSARLAILIIASLNPNWTSAGVKTCDIEDTDLNQQSFGYMLETTKEYHMRHL